jgi:hypothetical protein
MAGALFLRRAQAATRRPTLNAMMMMRTNDGSGERSALFSSFKRRREYDAVGASSLFRLAPSITITKRTIASCAGSGSVVGISDSSSFCRRTRFAGASSEVFGFKNHACSDQTHFSSIASGARSILKIPSFKVAKVSYTGAVSFLEMKTV